ncbi:MAG TPA: PDZ domain-containing protein [Candidatus Acidoferrum sp.]|nr:PDZ domain-containing protein [Candidatus Acidoferrum sp.]
MNKRNLLITGGVAALSLALIALPAPSANSQTPCPDESVTDRLAERLAQLQAKLQGRQDEVAARLAEANSRWASWQMALAQHRQTLEQLETLPALAGDDDQDGVSVFLDAEGSSWLGVELHEVTSDTAKELKLPAERGVVLGSIVPDSPAAKAGLKENDVVTEINGQRIEGAAQFRRVIREIPAGRAAQITVWRDGRAQTISVTLGKAEERRHSLRMFTPAPGAPGSFAFTMPEIPMVPPMEWDGSRFMMGGQPPRLGIDAEDLSGQLGSFFGAPDGEGVLVREVNPGSAAEKGGLKAGDVITSVNGERIRTVGDLREKLAAKREAKDKDKDQAVKLSVLRNKSEVSLTVELPAPSTRTKRFISHRTNI